MPNIKSAIKRDKQNKKRNLRNRMVRSTYRTAIKKFLALLQMNRTDEAKRQLPELHREIDTAARKGILKKETASRKKSRMTVALNKIQTPASA